jgi:drug/metabolite transporter (DMT)-like permease
MKERLQRFVVIGALLILLGVILAFFSVTFGTSMADSWLASRGEADTGYYHIIVTNYINAFLVAGGVTLGFGLVLTSVPVYKLMDILES